MNKFLTAALAAAIALPAASPALAADYHRDGRQWQQNDRRDDRGRYDSRGRGYDNHGRYVSERAHARNDYRKWHRGDRFDRSYARNYRVVQYRGYDRLYAPPRGYQWVQSGNDALLIGITSGIVSAVIGNLF